MCILSVYTCNGFPKEKKFGRCELYPNFWDFLNFF